MERAIREHLSEEQLKLIRDWSVNLTFQFCALRTPFRFLAFLTYTYMGKMITIKKKTPFYLALSVFASHFGYLYIITLAWLTII